MGLPTRLERSKRSTLVISSTDLISTLNETMRPSTVSRQRVSTCSKSVPRDPRIFAKQFTHLLLVFVLFEHLGEHPLVHVCFDPVMLFSMSASLPCSGLLSQSSITSSPSSTTTTNIERIVTLMCLQTRSYRDLWLHVSIGIAEPKHSCLGKDSLTHECSTYTPCSRGNHMYRPVS